MKRLLWIPLASLGGLVGPLVLAQDAPPATPPAAQPRGDTQALDYLYNRAPADGSAAGTATDDYRSTKAGAAGKQNALESVVASESLLAPDFEKFLSASEANKEQLQKYQALYAQTMAYLNARKPVEAWQLLSALSTYEWDSGLSTQIANRVRAVWDTDATARGLLSENDKLQAQVKTSNWNADLNAESAKREAEKTKKSTDGAAPAASSAVNSAASGMPGTLRMTEEYFKSLDSKARIKLNEVKVDNIKSKARTDLVEYISTLFKSKRYGHALLAAQFYQALFVDGELPPEVANQATAALEASRNIANAVDVFRFKIQQKQVTTATTILEKAWETGDTTPEMLGLERDLKLNVIDHANRVRRMRNLIEARDFENLELVLNEMDAKAVDYDTTKPRALIQAIKLDSRMRLGRARLLAQQGNPAKAMEEFKAAAESWPGNPDLNSASNTYFSSEDASAKALVDFDREMAANNYRAIADKQLQYLAFVQTDDKRQGQFKQALEKVRDAETALEKARLLDTSGDTAGAWETIDLALQGWPDDTKLNQAMAQYSSRASQFASAIAEARKAEADHDTGASLSLYALAKNQYPPSQTAATALKRLTSLLLDPPPEKKDADPKATAPAAKT